MGLEARQALSYVSTMSLANSGAYVASSWHALPAFHGEPFRILLGTRGSCCHLNLLLVYRTVLNEGLQVTALLSFCSPSKGKDPGTPLLSLTTYEMPMQKQCHILPNGFSQSLESLRREPAHQRGGEGRFWDASRQERCVANPGMPFC